MCVFTERLPSTLSKTSHPRTFLQKSSFPDHNPFFKCKYCTQPTINRDVFRVECTLWIWPAHALFSLTVMNSYFGKQREWLTVIKLQTAPQHEFHYSHRFPVSVVNDTFWNKSHILMCCIYRYTGEKVVLGRTCVKLSCRFKLQPVPNTCLEVSSNPEDCD